MDVLPIQTARLVLRRFTPEDLEAFQAYRSDPVLARYQGWEPMPDEQARLFLAGQARQVLGAAGQWLQVAMTLRHTGEVIGDLGLCVVDETEGVVELGFTVARSSQGQGYATEAVTAVLEALLGHGGVRSALAVTDARNTASVALLRRLGFGHERTTTSVFRGEPCQEQTFVLTKTQWARTKSANMSGSMKLPELRIVLAQPEDLARYINLLEELATWLESRGIQQWRSGNFRLSSDYFAESIKQEEVHFAFLGDELAGTFRMLLREPIVWPEIIADDAVYIYNLAVRRSWAKQRLGRRMLEWIETRAVSLDRTYVRLDCVAENEFLRSYYEGAGFLDRGEIAARFPEPFGTLRIQRYEKRVQTI